MSLSEIMNAIKKLKNKFDELKQENKALKQKVETLEFKISKLDHHNRKNNIIIHGLTGNFTNQIEIEREVFDILNNNLKSKCSDHDIVFIKKLGNKTNAPILVGFTNWRKKFNVLRNKKWL